MTTEFKWYGDDVMKKIQKKLEQRLYRAAGEWQRTAVRGVSVAGRGMSSTPGVYPHKQTGHLRRNINKVVEGDKLIALVGTNVEYGRYLEEGTKNIAPRPWMKLTNNKTRRRIRAIMKRPL